jgi:hypothetical protein
MRSKALLLTVPLILALGAPPRTWAQEPAATTEDPKKEEPGTKTPDRLDAVEKKVARDRLNFTGEIRVANDFIRGTQPAHFDGMALQKSIVDTLFYMRTNGGLPTASGAKAVNAFPDALSANIAAHYSE